MDMKTLREQARQKMKGFCHVCPICDGKACMGQVPGMGGAITGSSFYANYQALQDTKINLRTVHDCLEPDTSIELFGIKLAIPIMNGPMAGPNFNCGPYDDYLFQQELMQGTTDAGSLYWAGDPCKKDEFMNGCRALKEAGQGVIISKPHIELPKIIRRFEWAQEHGARVFGMDLDGAGILSLRRIGYPVGPKSVAELKKLRAFSPGEPFIIKGIMTVDDALRCADAGASAIVISNHGGRVLDGTPGVADVLGPIAQAVGNSMDVLADGAVRSGIDVLRLIALGAKAVLIGRPLCWGVYGGGAKGVKLILDTYADQLQQAMILTGCRNIKAIGPQVLFQKP